MKSLRSLIFLFIIILASVYLWIQGNVEYGFEFNWVIFFLSLLTLFSAIMLAILFSKDGISLRVVYWFYSFLFLGLVPVFQYSAGIWRFDIKVSVVPYAVCIVFLSHLFYLIGYNFGSKIALKINNSATIRLISDKRLIISVLFFIFTIKRTFIRIINSLKNILTLITWRERTKYLNSNHYYY